MMAELADEAASGDDSPDACRGGAGGEALSDAWFAGACDTVDRLLVEPLGTPSTPSTVSTSRPGAAS